jgi:hypothetical protein
MKQSYDEIERKNEQILDKAKGDVASGAAEAIYLIWLGPVRTVVRRGGLAADRPLQSRPFLFFTIRRTGGRLHKFHTPPNPSGPLEPHAALTARPALFPAGHGDDGRRQSATGRAWR